MKSTITKNCPWCLKDFQTTNQKQITCCSSHRIYMSQYKNGKRDAPEVWSQEKDVKELTLASIEHGINQLKPKIPVLIEQLKQARTDIISMDELKIKHNQDIRKINKEVEKLEDVGNDFFEKEELVKRENLAKSLVLKRQRIESNLPKNDLIYKDLIVQYKDIKLQLFRIEQQFKNYLQTKITLEHKGAIPANLIPKIEAATTVYPFAEMFSEHHFENEIDNYHLQGLGNLKQPFIAIFEANFSEGKYNLYHYFQWLGENLIIEYKTKVIYFIQDGNKEFIDDLKDKSIEHEDYIIIPIERKVQIESTIIEYNPEFIFLTFLNGIDFNYLKSLQKRFNKTSIFIVSQQTPNNDIIQFSDLVIGEDEDDLNLIKGGNPEYLTHVSFQCTRY